MLKSVLLNNIIWFAEVSFQVKANKNAAKVFIWNFIYRHDTDTEALTDEDIIFVLLSQGRNYSNLTMKIISIFHLIYLHIK